MGSDESHLCPCEVIAMNSTDAWKIGGKDVGGGSATGLKLMKRLRTAQALRVGPQFRSCRKKKDYNKCDDLSLSIAFLLPLLRR